MTQKTTKQPKEGLHTQGKELANFEASERDIRENCLAWACNQMSESPPEDLDFIAESCEDYWKDGYKEGYVKAVNERQALLDSHSELLEALKNATEDLKNMACNYAGYSFGEGRKNHYSKLASYAQAQTAINNAKNI